MTKILGTERSKADGAEWGRLGGRKGVAATKESCKKKKPRIAVLNRC